VKVFEDHEQRLLAGLSQEKVPHGIESGAAPLRRIERLPRGIVHAGVEQGQECWQQGAKALIKREKLANDFLADNSKISRGPGS
jgi:hypothetical protein